MLKVTTDRANALATAARNFIAKVDSGEARSKRSYEEFKAALEEYYTASAWRSVRKELPPPDTLVEVCGYSGMSSNKYFLCYALHMPTYRPREPWRAVQHEALSDYGWVAEFWRFPEALPEMLARTEMTEYDGDQ